MEQIAFVVQKIILRLLFPVSIALLLGITALIFRRRSTLSLWLVYACVLWLLVASFPITGLILIRSIESGAGDYANPEDLSRDGVKYVVVLSGGFRQGPLTSGEVPVKSTVTSSSDTMTVALTFMRSSVMLSPSR